jgi:hypothetical protein
MFCLFFLIVTRPGVLATMPMTTSSRIRSQDAPGGCVFTAISWLVPSTIEAHAPSPDAQTTAANIRTNRFIP